MVDYDSCLKYYQQFHTEYPEALQVAAAKYMTSMAMGEVKRERVLSESWDFMAEIEEIKKQTHSTLPDLESI